MKPSEMTETLAYYTAIFNTTIPEPAKVIWRGKLEDLPAPDVRRAIDAHAASGAYPPNPVQLRAAALTDEDCPTASEAWVEVMAEVARVGDYGQPLLSNMSAYHAVEAIGWHAICMSDSETSWMFDRFCRIYDAHSDTVTIRAALTPHDVAALVDGIGKPELP